MSNKSMCVLALNIDKIEDYTGFRCNLHEEIEKEYDEVIVVLPMSAQKEVKNALNKKVNSLYLTSCGRLQDNKKFRWQAYKKGIEMIYKDSIVPDDLEQLTLIDGDLYGPISSLSTFTDLMHEQNTDIWSLDRVISAESEGCAWDFISFNRKVIENNLFFEFWANLSYNSELYLSRILLQLGFTLTDFVSQSKLEGVDALLEQAPIYIDKKIPFMPRRVLFQDPSDAEGYCTYARLLLDKVDKETDYDVDLIRKDVFRNRKLREISSVFDGIRVIPSVSSKPVTADMRIAVLIHAYYAEALDDILPLLTAWGERYELFVSTASNDQQLIIEKKISGSGYKGVAKVVRVEQNRGRDMSALFITLRDVVLSDNYDLILRLHSKKTPQVPQQMSRSFKDHLIGNLICTPGYINNIVKEFCDDSMLGMVIPPTIQVGFSALSHGWYNNKSGVEALLSRLGIVDIKLDDVSPVAAYGTMFWFRPDALKPMFEEDWGWDEYNKEPNHIDGGLSHLQERVLCYVAQSQGYGILQAMSHKEAERNYAKLEYKYMSLASNFTTGGFAGVLEELKSNLH